MKDLRFSEKLPDFSKIKSVPESIREILEERDKKAKRVDNRRYKIVLIIAIVSAVAAVASVVIGILQITQ